MPKQYPRLQETLYETTLQNGLRVFYLPKPGFSKTFAMLAVNFGSIDESFTLDGARYDMPAGIAHFLEHKMFEEPDGNALQKFAATGAQPNAFTSHKMTAYHFTCADRFAENLDILLRFVFTPYFTEENVAKERGIIAQEIGMRDDSPEWRAMIGLYEGLFEAHPIRRSIAGSVASIARITPEILSACHRAFYSPANMALVVAGNADFDAICAQAEALSPTESPRIAARHYGALQKTAYQPETRQRMTVSRPHFMLGLLDTPPAPGADAQRQEIVCELALRILCGRTAPLYTRLFEQRLISASFDLEYSMQPDACCAILAGDSPDPRKVQAAVEKELCRLAQDGVPDAVFHRQKRALYGMSLRVLDMPEELARQLADCCFQGGELLRFPEVYDSIAPEEIRAAYERWARAGTHTLSIVAPLDDANPEARA